MTRQNWRFANQDARDKCAEDGVHADQISDQRHRAHDQQDGGDHRKIAGEDIIDPADDNENNAPADCQAEAHEGECSENALGEAQHVDVALQREAEDDGRDHPPNGVVDDRRCKDDLADRAAHEIHLADYGGNDLDRGDRQRRAKKERSNQAFAGVRQHGVRQCFPECNTTYERHDDACERRNRGRAARPPDQPQIGLHAGEQQQHQHPELRNRIEHRLLLFCGGKNGVLKVGEECAEQGRA